MRAECCVVGLLKDQPLQRGERSMHAREGCVRAVRQGWGLVGLGQLRAFAMRYYFASQAGCLCGGLRHQEGGGPRGASQAEPTHQRLDRESARARPRPPPPRRQSGNRAPRSSDQRRGLAAVCRNCRRQGFPVGAPQPNPSATIPVSAQA